jgi:hypothetical protein
LTQTGDGEEGFDAAVARAPRGFMVGGVLETVFEVLVRAGDFDYVVGEVEVGVDL